MSRTRTLIVVGLVAAGLLAAGCSGREEVTQPFAFNHKVHIDSDVECLQCHEGVLDPEEYRLPPLEMCASCHKDKPPADKPQLARLAKLVQDKTELVWDPALRLPDHVFFPHIRHVDVAELECSECHGDMLSRTTPPPYRRIVTMSACIACHEKNSDRPSAKRAVTDCASCHR